MAFSRTVTLHQEQSTNLVLFSGPSLIKPQVPTEDEESLPDPEQWPLPTGSPLRAAPTPSPQMEQIKLSEQAAMKHELYSSWQNISSTPQLTQDHPELLGNLGVGHLSLFLKTEKWNKLFLDKDIY